MKAVLGEWRYSCTHSLILALDGGDRKLGGPQSHSGCSGEEKNSQSALGIKL
jgi:hypothetical protein